MQIFLQNAYVNKDSKASANEAHGPMPMITIYSFSYVCSYVAFFYAYELQSYFFFSFFHKA
jgi:hypothetical protein